MPQPDDAIVFINYRRTDAGWPADHLADKLRAAFGKDRVFLDVRDIKAGDDFTAELERQLQRAAALIVLIGKSWLFVHDEFGRRRLDQKNDWVRSEIRGGLKQDGCRVIPVLLDDADLPDKEGALPKDISALLKRQRIRIRQASSEADIGDLIKVLDETGFRRPAASAIQRAGSSEPPLAREDVLITLTIRKAHIENDLRELIERGKKLLDDVHRDPPMFQDQPQELLDIWSRHWHAWRRSSESILARSFSALEPLKRLRALTPHHLDFERPLKDRAEDLPRDIEKELAYLENLLSRLDNYEEPVDKDGL